MQTPDLNIAYTCKSKNQGSAFSETQCKNPMHSCVYESIFAQISNSTCLVKTILDALPKTECLFGSWTYDRWCEHRGHTWPWAGREARAAPAERATFCTILDGGVLLHAFLLWCEPVEVVVQRVSVFAALAALEVVDKKNTQASAFV